MKENPKIIISENTLIVEMQHELDERRKRVLMLSEMLLQADAEITRLRAVVSDLTAREAEAAPQVNDAEGSE